mgnify:CR=1 FL=1
MKRFLRQILPAALCLSALGGCMKWDYGRTEDFSATERGLFIVCLLYTSDAADE